MKLLLFLLPYFTTGLVISLAAILIERLMIYVGWTQGNAVYTFLSVFIATVLFQIVEFPKPITFDWYLFAGLFIGLMTVNRHDLSITMQKGRWWWKSTTEPN